MVNRKQAEMLYFHCGPRDKKILIRLEQKEEYSTLTKSSGINNNKKLW